LTHDLFVNTLALLGASVTSVVVTEVRDRTYFAEVHLKTAAGVARYDGFNALAVEPSNHLGDGIIRAASDRVRAAH